jgi:hypothetical protein
MQARSHPDIPTANSRTNTTKIQRRSEMFQDSTTTPVERDGKQTYKTNIKHKEAERQYRHPAEKRIPPTLVSILHHLY